MAQNASEQKQTTDGGSSDESTERTAAFQLRKQELSGTRSRQADVPSRAPWLIRPEREEEERASESFKQLKLAPGMAVCDLGCGNGYWTLPMARDVGEGGKVYAVDIQREMLQKLRQRSSKYKLNNIEPVLGKVDDPNLPANQMDLVLMVDVYHEFSHPESMLWGIRRSLKPKGVVALLEYREEDPNVPIKPLHKMSKLQIMNTPLMDSNW